MLLSETTMPKLAATELVCHWCNLKQLLCLLCHPTMPELAATELVCLWCNLFSLFAYIQFIKTSFYYQKNIKTFFSFYLFIIFVLLLILINKQINAHLINPPKKKIF